MEMAPLQTTWEDLAIDDIDVRLKWAGLFHRKKRTPGRFMMRLKVCVEPHPISPPFLPASALLQQVLGTSVTLYQMPLHRTAVCWQIGSATAQAA